METNAPKPVATSGAGKHKVFNHMCPDPESLGTDSGSGDGMRSMFGECEVPSKCEPIEGDASQKMITIDDSQTSNGSPVSKIESVHSTPVVIHESPTHDSMEIEKDITNENAVQWQVDDFWRYSVLKTIGSTEKLLLLIVN